MKRFSDVMDIFCLLILLLVILFGYVEVPFLLTIIALYLMKITFILEKLLTQSAAECPETTGAAPPRH